MFTVYLLKSLKTGKNYGGFTNKSAEERLIDHNQGSNQWTRANKPLKLIYYEKYFCEKDARSREKFLKSGVGSRIIKAI